MDNNVKLISSIGLESDFENLVKLYIQKIYDVKAYLVGGPWDNGKDLVLNRRGREIREAFQISIQEKNIEAKVEADLKKVIKLVDEHNYPPILNFFWSYPISEYTLDKLRTLAKNKYFITLEVYDAKRISQDITDNYPDVLNYLMKDIHKYEFDFDEEINIQQRTFYEYLLLSKDSTSLKNAIIDASILSNLNDKEKSLEEIEADINEFNINKNSLRGKLSNLIQQGKVISTNGLYSLTEREILKIENIRVKQSSRRNEIILTINNEINKYTSKSDLANHIVKLITKAYEESVNVQISESKFEPPKTAIFNTTFNDLKKLIQTECKLSIEETEKLSEKLMNIAGQNDYLSEHCSTKLCINLLADRNLEKYIENKKFYIYLDAPVLIPYLLTIMFSDKRLFDKSIANVDLMRSHINNLKNKKLRVSNEHFEETVRHLEQADKLSRFVTKELIDELGESKNIYFNTYIRWVDNHSSVASFEDFIYNFIGLEQDDIPTGNRFDIYSSYIHSLLVSSNFDVVNHSNDFDEKLINRIKTRYIREAKTTRNSRSIENDIICALTLSNDKFHLDENGYFSTPMLITLDAYQYQLRQIIRREFKYAEWLVYTPQRAIERLSLIGLKISPECLKDGVLAAISEEYFFKENTSSLLDTLSILIADEKSTEGDVIKFVTQLKRKVTEEAVDKSEIGIDKYNNISYVLLYIYREFRDEFSKIVRLFNDESLRNNLSKILLQTIDGNFQQDDKDKLSQEISTLIKTIN